ncbi:MAG TPA: aminotransferase class III-fold pyridoxal phosphate-dependent enzyme [Thermoanaerobaculia bacterium]|nr:aminotransferase class III-fold pyridoxal phosphate-dependent enzyme [Thermoanaerobaculia bacterium]
MTAAYTEHVNPTFGRFLSMTGRDLQLVHARDTTLTTADGRTFDDWVAGFGSFNLGHNPDVVLDAVRHALEQHAPNLFPENVNPAAGELASALTRAAGAPFEVAHFTNSGSEAVEMALKTAIIATGKTKVAYADGAFHGTTIGAISCAGEGPFREKLEGILHDFVEVPFGDAGALERDDLAAFIVEPVQMEGGARVASAEYLRDVLAICRRRGTLLLFDEVQTGMGRSGHLFAFQALGVVPDVVILAKALGGGVMPIGAALMSRELWSRAWSAYTRCQASDTTFGGNTLSCRAAIAALDAVSQPEFLANVRERGEELFASLHARIGGSPLVARISSLGLMGGIELRDPSHPWLGWSSLGLPELEGHPVAGPMIIDRLQRNGILAQVSAHDWSVVRVEPPLTVSRATCERFVDAVARAIEWLEANA